MYVNRQVDVLLVVDNPPAMAPYGNALRANLHLGVITADPADDANLRGMTGLTGNFIADGIGAMRWLVSALARRPTDAATFPKALC
jgi:hypothetical protein